MSETYKSTAKKAFAVIFASLYVIAALLNIFPAICPIPDMLFPLLMLSGTPALILSLIAFMGFLLCTGKNGIALILFPSLLILTLGFTFGMSVAVISAMLDFLPYSLCAWIAYKGYKNGSSHALTCSLSALLLLAAALLNFSVIIFDASSIGSMSFSSYLFDSIENFISGYVSTMNRALAEASALSPELAQAYVPLTVKELLPIFTTVIVLLPAAIYCTGFFTVFFATAIVDRINKKAHFVSDTGYGKYTISGTTNVFFTVCGIILVFALFFDAGMSAFTYGMLSVVMAILPHYIILGYRRLYNFIRIFCHSAVVSVIIVMVISALAVGILPQLFICILAFLGSSEYRASARAKE